MQMITKTILAICSVGAVAVATLTPADARCPQGWTVQGGRCQPYRWGGSGYAWQRPGWNNNWGPGWNNNWGGGWNTWNGCRPGHTVQGGRCAPYRWGR